jgi:peptidoglycan/xylan/chitin deacetylase (PgdA/CDA1 family)
MEYLQRWYRLVTLDELCHELESPSQVGPAVAVTFDDGYRDLYTYAFPILRQYRIPATVFLIVESVESSCAPWYDRVFVALRVFPSDRIELELDAPVRFDLASTLGRMRAAEKIVSWLRKQPDAHRRQFCAALEKRVRISEHELRGRMLDWGQIREMQREGISFGSHTLSHPVISRLDAAAAEHEISESKRVLEEKLQGPVRHFAFPFGQPADCGTSAQALLARCGYRSASTTIWGVNRPGVSPHALYRVQLGEERSLAMFALKLNQLFFSGVSSAAPTGSPLVSSELPPALNSATRASWS